MKFFQKKPPKKRTRLFFATDRHGSQRTFRKFVNTGKFYEAYITKNTQKSKGINVEYAFKEIPPE